MLLGLVPWEWFDSSGVLGLDPGEVLYGCFGQCRYVCIEVALRGNVHGIGRPTGPGGGDHQKWVQCPNPAGTVKTMSRTLDHTHAHTLGTDFLASSGVLCMLFELFLTGFPRGLGLFPVA